MKFYLVGGAIRDRLLGLNVRDKDWVVIGSTYKDMIKLGFIPVGNDFPVFLHPITYEEYALARKEKKNGQGYHGFLCNYSKYVTLREDLYRRDLTINAIAMDVNGNYYDPYNGLLDIKNRVIKHISYHFLDDPLRILRIAKFYSFYYKFGFFIHKNTIKLIINKINFNEILSLKLERIWLETKKVFLKCNFFIYINVLYKLKVLDLIYPEIFLLFLNKKKLYFFSLLFNNLNMYKFGLDVNLLCFFCFFDCTILSDNFFLNNKYILKKIENFCKKFSISNKKINLFKCIYNFLRKIFFFTKNSNIYILFYELMEIINIWRNPNIIVCIFNFIKVLSIKPVNKKIFSILNKYIIDLYYITNNLKNKYLINLNYKGIEIGNKIKFFRFKKIYFFLKSRNY